MASEIVEIKTAPKSWYITPKEVYEVVETTEVKPTQEEDVVCFTLKLRRLKKTAKKRRKG